jgi:neopullulanase
VKKGWRGEGGAWSVAESLCAVGMLLGLVLGAADGIAQSSEAGGDAPVVAKVEPPNWWIGLTPEVMVLLSGRGLNATKVECNLPNLLVERTQATAGGKYLFVWLKFGAALKSGTAVCRATSTAGTVAFELPLAARMPTIHRFQGLTPEDVIYLIMPDRFANGDPTNDEAGEEPGSHVRAKARAYHGGDLRGIREHLRYLQDLGVSTLWLTPVVKNGAAQDYHGYGAVDLYAVEPHLGTLKEYQDLVSDAHTQHLKVMFDIVPNHVGPRHPWVANPPLPDWFHGTLQQHSNALAGSSAAFYGETPSQSVGHDPFELLVDPHAPPRLTRNLTEGWFFGALPDLNTENPIVAQYLLQNAIWWAESSGLDGYRIDTFPYVPRNFWATWNTALRRIYPRLTTIGEVFHPDPSVTSFFAGGQKRYDGIDSSVTTLFDYPMYFALRDVLLHGAPAGRIADILRHDALYPRPEQLVTFFANHDVARFASMDGSSPAKTKLMFGLLLTLRGIPQLYYGDEIGMAGGDDPDNRRDFPGGWPGDSRSAFTQLGRSAEQQAIFESVHALLKVRREHPALSIGRLWHVAANDAIYVFVRESDDEKVLVIFNDASQSRGLRVPIGDSQLQGAHGATLLFGSATAEISEGEIVLKAPAESLSIFALN